jgi:hypothetical protein
MEIAVDMETLKPKSRCEAVVCHSSRIINNNHFVGKEKFVNGNSADKNS